MRVHFVNRFFYPDHAATSQILTDLAFVLAGEAYDVRVVASRLRYDDPGARLAAREDCRGVRVRRVWTSRFGRRWLPGRALDYLTFYLSATLALLLTVRRGDVLVAMTDPPLISVPAALVTRLRGARLVNWLQDVFPEVAEELGMPGGGGVSGRILRAFRDASLRAAAVNVVLGERMAERVRARRGVQARRVQVIPNWADGTAVVPVAREANPLRRDWGLGDRFVVGYSGNLGRAHDFADLVAAADALRDDDRVVFLFIGGGARQADLSRTVAEKGLANVQFRPYQPRERLSRSLGVADLHVVSLRPALEGLIVPSKLYGAAAAGRPVLFIGDPDGEVARLCRRFQAGWAVVPGDRDRLVDLIRALAADPRPALAAGGHARRMLEDEFSLEHAARGWAGLLDAIASGAEVPASGGLVPEMRE